MFMLLLLAPVLALAGAVFRGLLLFWPVMLVLGALHSYFPIVPAVGFEVAFLIVMLFGLLLPGGVEVDS